jgi:hypothetical protein
LLKRLLALVCPLASQDVSLDTLANAPVPQA